MSPRDMIAHMRKRRTVLRCAGLCIVCGKKKTENGNARCSECQQSTGKSAAIYALTAEQDKKNLVKLGICTRCKSEPAVPGKTICSGCREKQALGMEKKKRTMAEKWREQGLCPRCGKRRPAAGREYCLSCNNVAIWRPERTRAKVTFPMVRQYLDKEPAKAEFELQILQEVRDVFLDKFYEYTSDIRINAQLVKAGMNMGKKLCKGVDRMVIISQWIRDEEGRESEDLLQQLQENAARRRDCLHVARLVLSYGAGVQG